MGKEDKTQLGDLEGISAVGTAVFVHVFEPHAFKGDDGKEKEPEYRIMLVFDQGTDLSAMKKVCGKALIKKFGESEAKRLAKKFTLPFRDAGDYAEEHGEPFEDGKMMVSFSSRTPPQVIDKNGKVVKPMDFYSGCEARVSFYAHAYAHAAGKKGIKFLLNNVQKQADGERIGGVKRDAKDEFGVGGGDEFDSDVDDLF